MSEQRLFIVDGDTLVQPWYYRSDIGDSKDVQVIYSSDRTPVCSIHLRIID